MSDERTQRMIDAYKEGRTLQEIGPAEGVSGERVRQILRKAGVTYKHSGTHRRALSKTVLAETQRALRREEHCQKSYGCDWATFKKVTGSNAMRRAGPVVRAYWDHKRNAQRSHIEWSLTLPEYMELVGPRLREIGRGRMTLCRLDKVGPFSRENVQVLSQRENSLMARGFDKARSFQQERSARRQAEAVALAAQGLCRREIAERMGLSVQAINSYFYRASHD